MGIYEELQARGLIAQVTDEEEIRELVNNGKAIFYIGFDPTADSLHVGHFMALCLMKRLQEAGIKVVSIEWLRERARLLTGEPQPIEFTDRVVAVVRYRDGSVIDVVHQVKE